MLWNSSSIGHPSGLPVSQSLTLLPLYTLATMRSLGFRPGMKRDDRTSAFLQFKTLPLAQVNQYIYMRSISNNTMLNPVSTHSWSNTFIRISTASTSSATSAASKILRTRRSSSLSRRDYRFAE